MATKADPNVPESIDPAEFVHGVKVDMAELYGLPIIGRGDYFSLKNADDLSVNLRELQLYVNAIVSAHDTLADETGNKRLVGKRGRKSGSTKAPTTVDDVIARLTK